MSCYIIVYYSIVWEGHMTRIFWHHGLSKTLGYEEMSAGEYLAAQEDDE